MGHNYMGHNCLKPMCAQVRNEYISVLAWHMVCMLMAYIGMAHIVMAI